MSHDDLPTYHRHFILGLRLQAERKPGERLQWRLSLEDSRTAERMGFRSLAELEAFLAAWMSQAEHELA